MFKRIFFTSLLFMTFLSCAVIRSSHAAENWDSWLERSKNAASKAWGKSNKIVEEFASQDELGGKNSAVNSEKEYGKKNALFGEMWSKITPKLDDVLTLLDKQDVLPDSSWFGKDKSDAQSELNAILDEAIEILGISNAAQIRHKIQTLEQKIQGSKEELADYRQKKIGAPVKSNWKTTVSNYESKINQTNRSIRQNKTDIRKLKLKFSRALNQIGVNITHEQVDLLLSSVVGDDIIQGSVVYSNVKEVSQQLMNLTVESREDINVSKRYYGFYTILLKVLLHMQNTFIYRIDENYIPLINEIVTEVKTINGNTRRLLKDNTKGSHRNHLLANIETQDLTIKTSVLYKRHLLGQRAKVKAANKKTIADFDVARNTYKTVKVSGELVSLLRSSQKAFATLINIQTPDLLIFENIQMKQEFALLTKKLNSSQKQM